MAYNFLRWKKASVINRAVQDWLDERASSPATDEPFCLYLHYVDPHSPYEAPKNTAKRFTNPDYSGRITGNHRQLDRIASGKLEVNVDDIEHLNALYDAGHTITCFTARGMGRHKNNPLLAVQDFYELTSRQLKEWGVKYHHLFLGKPNGDVYVDDKGVKDG